MLVSEMTQAKTCPKSYTKFSRARLPEVDPGAPKSCSRGTLDISVSKGQGLRLLGAGTVTGFVSLRSFIGNKPFYVNPHFTVERCSPREGEKPKCDYGLKMLYSLERAIQFQGVCLFSLLM